MQDQLAISVTKENIPRALRFMNSLIKLLRARNHQIQIGHRATALVIDGETHEVKLLEKCTRKVVREGRWRETELVPTGLLALKLSHCYSAKEWVDGKQTLEQQLTKIVAALEIRSENEKQERAKRDKYRAEQDRLKAIEKRLVAERAWEQKKVEILLSHATKWKQARDLALFLSEIEKIVQAHGNPTVAIRDWLVWVKKVQESIDPLSEGMESFVDKYLMPD